MTLRSSVLPIGQRSTSRCFAHLRAEVRVVAALGVEVGAHRDDHPAARIIAVDHRQQAPDKFPSGSLVVAQSVKFLHLVDDQQQRLRQARVGERVCDLCRSIIQQSADRDAGPDGKGIFQLPYRIRGRRNPDTVIPALQVTGSRGGRDETGREHR